MTVLDRIASRRLVLVTGKGGVGKSVVTAALVRLLAERGRRVHAVEVDPRESLYGYLGVDPSGGDVVAAGARTTLQNLDPRHVVDGLVREFVPVDLLVKKVLASPVYRHFSEGAPGLKEAVALGYAVRCTEAEHWPAKSSPAPDIVLVDAPASGHAVSMLEAAPLLSDAVRRGPIGRLIAELAAFLGDSEKFGVVLVAVAEEMPVDETLELIAALDRKRGIRPEAVIVNGLYPPLPKGLRRRPRDRAAALWYDRRRLNEREHARLAERWDGPVVELPLVAADGGPDLTAALLPVLEEALRDAVEAAP